MTWAKTFEQETTEKTERHNFSLFSLLPPVQFFRTIMTENDFLQEILANPDDDGPRLIFADWLEERGDPRGEFIRVQIALANLPEDDPGRGKLLLRQRKLWKAHEDQWFPLADKSYQYFSEMRRGFLEHIDIPVDEFVTRGQEFFDQIPLRSVRFFPADDQPQLIAKLARFPLLKRISSLAFHSAGLDLQGNRLGLNHESLEILLSSPHLIGLRSLEIPGNDLGDAAMMVLAQWSGGKGLISLNLAGNQIGATGVQLLANSAHLKNLHTLNLSENPIGLAGAQALSSSSLPAGLTHLDLGRCQLGTRGLQALCSGKLAELTNLVLRSNHIGINGGSILVRASWLSKVRHLDLSRNQLTEKGVIALAASPHIANLVHLDLRRNRITDEGALALIQSPHLRNLISLDLSRNRFGYAAACRFANCDNLPNLTRLDLRNINLTPKERQKLRKQFGKRFARL
jgi:uncharacterized protein (TIGR02996 family)